MKTTGMGLACALGTWLTVAACSSGEGDPPLSASNSAASGAGGSATTASATVATGTTSSADSSATSGGGAPDLTAFAADAAKAVCGALFRCCDAKSVTEYFTPLANDQRLGAFAAKLPPNASIISEGACSELLGAIFAVAPFGSWLDATKEGKVTFIPQAFASCVDTLDVAACGKPIANALFDSTCFGFAPPSGGAEQRSMFVRSSGIGAPCSPLNDGIGASFYGSCDPTAAFCCYDDPTKPGLCGYPYDAKGKARAGTCKAVSALGAACDALKDVQLCKTGDTCDAKSGTCVASAKATLAKGQTCIDGSYNLLGDCANSFCDVLGSKKCEALKPTGATCDGFDQCESGSCQGYACAPLTFCKG